MSATIYLVTSHRRGNATMIRSAYKTFKGARDRIDRIAKANAQYALRPVGPNIWKIGPDEDEGFFGNKPVIVAIVETELFDLCATDDVGQVPERLVAFLLGRAPLRFATHNDEPNLGARHGDAP